MRGGAQISRLWHRLWRGGLSVSCGRPWAAGWLLAVAGRLARVLAGWRTAGGELGLQAVEDGLEAELEVVLWRGGVVGGCCFEAGAQPRKLRRDVPGFGHGVADQRFGVAAAAAELARE